MKVYIYFLSIPEKPYGRITERMIDSFLPVRKHYEENYYKNKPGVYFELNGAIRILYAFTHKKELARDFEYLHDLTLFTKIERKMDKEEYSLFEEDMEHAKLEYYDLDDDSNMLLTKSEHYLLENSITDLEMTLSKQSCLGYEGFKDKYIHALDIILYTLYYQLTGPEAEFYDANFYGYGATPEGAAHDHVTMVMNFKQMYMDIFSLILK